MSPAFGPAPGFYSETILSAAGDYPSLVVAVCLECGAVVLDSRQAQHVAWHETLQEKELPL